VFHIIKFYFREFSIDENELMRGNIKDTIDPVNESMETDPETGGIFFHERWIYIFKCNVNRFNVELMAEIQVKATDQFRMVDWSDRDKWHNKDERRPGRPREDIALRFAASDIRDIKLYAFLSEIQLPYYRVNQYELYPVLLLTRAVELPRFPTEQPPATLTVTLPNKVRDLRKFQEAYLKNREKLEEMAPDEDKMARIQLANLTHSVAETYREKYEEQRKIMEKFGFEPWWTLKDLWGHVNKINLDLYLNQVALEFKKMEQYARIDDFLAQGKKILMRIAEVQLSFYDYNGAQNVERATLLYNELIRITSFVLRDSHKSKHTQEYLVETVGDEGIWYLKLLLGDESIFEPVKKSFTTTADVTEQMLIIYEQWAMAAVKNQHKVLRLLRKSGMRGDALEMIAEVLDQRIEDLGSMFNRLPNGKYFISIKPGRRIPNVVRFALVGEANDIIRRNTDLIERLKKQKNRLTEHTARIVFALNIVSLVNVWDSVRKAQVTGSAGMAYAELAVAIGDLTASAEFLLKKRFGSKIFKRVWYVTSIVDFAIDLKKMGASIEEGKWGLSIGYGISATGSAVLLFGTLTASTWWTGIGLLIAFGGMIILLIFQEDPLQKWLEASPWGIKSRKRLDAYSTAEITEELRKCYELIVNFSARISTSMAWIEIRIVFWIRSVNTRLLLQNFTLRHGGRSFTVERGLGLIGSSAETVFGRATTVRVRWTKEELSERTGIQFPVRSMRHQEFINYEAQVSFDLMGDGKFSKNVTLTGKWIYHAGFE
jgi:hypothetical protein